MLPLVTISQLPSHHDVDVNYNTRAKTNATPVCLLAAAMADISTNKGLESFRVPQLEAGQRPGHYAIFNSHSSDDILAALQEWGSQRILLVHSKALAAQSPHIDNLRSAFGTRLVSAKAGVGAHSPYADVIDIAHRITNNAVDCVVCVGSGSYSDACKAARLLAATLPPGFGEEDMEELCDQKAGIAPEDKMKKPEGIKLILVPTSLSAGEWNFAASSTNSSGKKQHFALQDGCAADLILMDPWVASTAPEQLWLSSGVRAVDHCVETLCNPTSAEHNGPWEWCESALRDLAKGLVEYKEGLDRGDDKMLHGITKCQLGSRLSLMSFMTYRVPMGPSHAIGHQLGSVAGVMHGITSCIMLPPVLRFTKAKTLEPQARVVKAFNDSMGWQETEAADCVARLVKMLGLPSTLKEVGVTTEEQIEKIIDKTMSDVLFSMGLVSERKDISDIVYSAR